MQKSWPPARRPHRRGWFAAMYRQTTPAVRDRVAAGGFDDRDLDPLHAWRVGRPVPRCAKVAFGAGGDKVT